MKTVKFAEDFPKLNNKLFTTIRLPSKKLKTGKVYRIKTPTREFHAILNSQTVMRVCEIPVILLAYDTGIGSPIKAFAKLQEFYPDLKATDPVKVFWFSRIKLYWSDELKRYVTIPED